MEDEDIETSSAGGLVPVALAALAIVLGGAGLYFGLTANQRINPLADSMEAGSTSASRLEKEISALQTKVTELSAQSSELKSTLGRMRLYSNQSEKAVKQLASNVKENRNEIVGLADRLNKMLSTGARPAPVGGQGGQAEETTTAVTSDLPSEGATTEKTYTIVSGDTFAKIAKKLDVGLQALLDANPDADPRRLKIGQVVNVPSN